MWYWSNNEAVFNSQLKCNRYGFLIKLTEIRMITKLKKISKYALVYIK
jgi:hypothetical protein